MYHKISINSEFNDQKRTSETAVLRQFGADSIPPGFPVFTQVQTVGTFNVASAGCWLIDQFRPDMVQE